MKLNIMADILSHPYRQNTDSTSLQTSNAEQYIFSNFRMFNKLHDIAAMHTVSQQLFAMLADLIKSI